MPKLIDVSSTVPLPPAVTVRAGDMLLVRASGGAVVAGDAVEALGAFGPATLGTNGSVIAAAGGPAAVLFLARAPGQASVRISRGDPWRSPKPPAHIDVTVEP